MKNTIETKREEALNLYSNLDTGVKNLASTIFGQGFDEIIESSQDEERLSLVIEAMKTANKIKN